MYSNKSDRPITTTEFIVHSLSKDILNGNIKSGTRLRQNDISAKFNVSATPVREALKVLTANGLISFDAYKGAIVKGLSYEDANEIYELRILLEAKLIKDAFKNYNENVLQKAMRVQEKINQCIDLNEWAVLNANFHRCFWESEASSRKFAIIENLLLASMPYVSLSLMYQSLHIDGSNSEHFEIIQAYKEKNLEKLIYLNSEHTKKTKNILFDVIQKTL